MTIVDYGYRAELAKKRFFNNRKISKKNKELMRKFLVAYDVSDARLVIFFDKIKVLLERTKDITKDMHNRDLINKVFKKIRELKTRQGNQISISTYATVVNVSIRFVRWFNDGNRPDGFKDLNSSIASKHKRLLSAKDMITVEDGDRLIKATNSIQLKAVIAIQLDGGFRPSEFIDLNYEDITQKGDFLIAEVRNGKTGGRPVILWRAVPHLLRWLQNHPTKKKDNPLWLQEKRTKGKILKYNYFALQKVLRSMGEKIKLGKPLDFYNIRHSACTISKIDNIPPEEAAKKFGHSVKFYTETYGRLTTEDSIERLSKVYGIVVDKKRIEHNVNCERCHFINTPNAEICEKCGAALSMKKALAVEKDKEKEILELKNQMEVWKNNIRKELMEEALNVMRKEIVQKSV